MAIRKKRRRLTLEFPEEARARMDDMRLRADAGSVAELIRKALRFYDLVLTETADGAEFMIRKDGELERIRVL